VVEEDGFDQALRQVEQVVVAAHVRQFVGQQGLEQLGRHAGQQRGRHQHHRPPPTGRDGTGERVDDAQAHRAWNAELRRHAIIAQAASRPINAHCQILSRTECLEKNV
jgi:hypothetical protein